MIYPRYGHGSSPVSTVLPGPTPAPVPQVVAEDQEGDAEERTGLTTAAAPP